MRKEYVRVRTRYMAAKLCPWVSVIAKCVGGYMCFENIKDYWTWRRQK